ncbi:MAG: alpha/beta hydrolase, partial [Firmicutes bacterium]|nr:alpha/beta hydrolase [Bacillota bacterium]
RREDLELTIELRQAGQGKFVILLHGIGSGADSFAELTQHLVPRFSVLVWNAPGYGLSSDPPRPLEPAEYGWALASALRAAGVERAVVVGHSFGAVVAAELAKHAPELVAGVVLADASVGDGAKPAQERERRWRERCEAIARLGPDGLAEQRVPELLAQPGPTTAYARAMAVMRQVRAAGYQSAAWTLHQAEEMRFWLHWRKPALLLWGAQDRVTTPEQAQALARAMPQARLVLLPQAGHLSYLEALEPFAREVAQFADAVG